MSKTPFPKEIPGTPILSSRFGERVLMDLKKLGTLGYCLVVVDHFTSYCWLGFLESKRAAGVAKFFVEAVAPDIKRIKEQRIEATKEAAAERADGVRTSPSPTNDDEDANGKEPFTMTLEAIGEYRKEVLEVRIEINAPVRVDTCYNNSLLYGTKVDPI